MWPSFRSSLRGGQKVVVAMIMDFQSVRQLFSYGVQLKALRGDYCFPNVESRARNIQ